MTKYIVKLESALYNDFTKTSKTYKEGLNIYNKLKQEFAGLDCTLVFFKEMIIHGEKVETVYWKKSLKNEKDLAYHFNKIKDSITAIKDIDEILKKRISELDSSIGNLYHLLELENVEDLSLEERDNVLNNTQIIAVKRRLLKRDRSDIQCLEKELANLDNIARRVCNKFSKREQEKQKIIERKRNKIKENKTNKYDKLLEKII